jgi:hypothetical protein
MKPLSAPGFLAGLLCASLLLPTLAQDDAPATEPNAELAAMMARARRFVQPGEHHALLERFLGRWTTETRFFMGPQASPPEEGTAEGTWLMEGRWMQLRSSGQMMGMPMQGQSVLGYDNFKMSYVVSSVSTMDTAMHYAEGDLDQGGRTLLLYGTLDEYLTGEHDKMVKTIWRFPADDEMVMEIHDLPIGENGTKVVEVRYRRAG